MASDDTAREFHRGLQEACGKKVPLITVRYTVIRKVSAFRAERSQVRDNPLTG